MGSFWPLAWPIWGNCRIWLTWSWHQEAKHGESDSTWCVCTAPYIRRPPIVAELKLFKPDTDWYKMFDLSICSLWVCTLQLRVWKFQQVETANSTAVSLGRSKWILAACYLVPAMAPTGPIPELGMGTNSTGIHFHLYTLLYKKKKHPINSNYPI